MSSLSRCNVDIEMPQALPAGTLIRILVVMTIMLAFGVTHLSLRFELVKMQRETSQLQALQGTLASEVKALQGRTEALKHPRRLYEYARLELGMVPYRPDVDKKELRMPAEVHRRYELARADLGKRQAVAAEESQGTFDRLSDRLGLISSALAGEEPGTMNDER